MPVVKSNEPLGVRPVVVVIYGDPGVCKTSLANTCEEPILLDFDRGVQRSFGRKDTLMPENWDEVIAEELAGTFRNYKTVVIDTAKAALDDYLMVYVVKRDFKMASNKLKAYGEIGDMFKLFTNNRRADSVDILIVAHSKKDEDTKRFIPDVTGQSYQLLMRIADQVGYVTIENGKRVISFNPTDSTVGKNVAGLPKLEIPDKNDPAFRNFGATIISTVKAAIDDMNEEQREALEKSQKYQEEIAAVTTPDELTTILAVVNELPEYLKKPLQTQIVAKAKENGWVANKETKCYEVAPVNGAATQPATNGAAPAPNGQVAPANTPASTATDPLFGIIESATGLDHISSIEKANADKIAASAELQQAIAAKKASFPAETQTPPAAATPPKRTRSTTPKPTAPAVAPAAPPAAAKQDLQWFIDRTGKDVWMQGVQSKPDHFTGVYNIAGPEYPEWLHGEMQIDGYLFRDATEAEITAAAKAAEEAAAKAAEAAKEEVASV